MGGGLPQLTYLLSSRAGRPIFWQMHKQFCFLGLGFLEPRTLETTNDQGAEQRTSDASSTLSSRNWVAVQDSKLRG